MLGVTTFLNMKTKNVRICKGYLHSNASCLILFVSDIYRYVSIWISNVPGDINLLKLIGTLNSNLVETEEGLYLGYATHLSVSDKDINK